MKTGHQAELIYWSTHQGGQDPAAAIATLKEGKLTPVDPKLTALIKAGVKIKLATVKGRRVLDVGFIGGGVDLPQLEEATYTHNTQSAQNAPVSLPEATQLKEATSVDPEEQARLERIRRHREANRVKPIHPGKMAMYLEACK
ncbi:TPA: hypothetical protein ACSP3M_004106 [Aeromonas veronii]